MSKLEVSSRGAFDFRTDKIASDKSISHRCAIFSLLSDKPSHIKNYLQAEDTLCTLNIIVHLGAQVQQDGKSLIITPPASIKEPPLILDCGNSGTAMRLLMGFLSARDGFFVLHGDQYLASRPMKRIADPLRKIGAKIDGRCDGQFAPIAIRGQVLAPFDYESLIASAQVKSALILAALRSSSPCFFSEPYLSRDHTEKMLSAMGADIQIVGKKIKITPTKTPLKPLDITVPNDPSSGFFFAVAAAIVPHAKVVLENMLLNPTRIEAYKILQKMGAKVTFQELNSKYESVGTITIEGASLCGVTISENLAWLIDELPALSIAFACAQGKSVVKNAQELRVKESDRISSVVTNLRKCGLHVEEFDDGYAVEGGVFEPACIDSFGDHRIAMSFALAGLKAPISITDIDCIQTSFPNFLELLSNIANTRVE